jgi:hypothetical protein
MIEFLNQIIIKISKTFHVPKTQNQQVILLDHGKSHKKSQLLTNNKIQQKKINVRTMII